MTTTEFCDGTVPLPPPLLEAPENDPQTRLSATGRSIHNDVRPAVAFRHSGWSIDRRRVGEALDRTRQTIARCDEFAHCGSHAYVLRSCTDPNRYRIAGSSCRDRFCLPCATERSYVIAGNVCELIRDKQVRFLTLTIKTDQLTLAEAIDKLTTSFQALRRRVLWKRAVSGGVAFLELKWSRTKSRWHPHLHCLIEGGFIRQRLIATAWREITVDSWVVDIRRPANNEVVARYITKYASKPFDHSYLRFPERLDEAIVALKGRKLAITFGTWRGVCLTATPDEGAWEHVASLETVLYRAANGDVDCAEILASITDRDLGPIFRLCPDAPPPRLGPVLSETQFDFFAAWQTNGSYRYRVDPS